MRTWSSACQLVGQVMFPSCHYCESSPTATFHQNLRLNSVTVAHKPNQKSEWGRHVPGLGNQNNRVPASCAERIRDSWRPRSVSLGTTYRVGRRCDAMQWNIRRTMEAEDPWTGALRCYFRPPRNILQSALWVRMLSPVSIATARAIVSGWNN